MYVQERKNICSSVLTSKLCRQSSSNGLSFNSLTNFAFPAINYCPDNPEMCTPGRKLVNFFQFGMTLQTNQGMSGKEIELVKLFSVARARACFALVLRADKTVSYPPLYAWKSSFVVPWSLCRFGLGVLQALAISPSGGVTVPTFLLRPCLCILREGKKELVELLCFTIHDGIYKVRCGSPRCGCNTIPYEPTADWNQPCDKHVTTVTTATTM